jgi:hypothetical protein
MEWGGDRSWSWQESICSCSPWKGKIESLRHDGVFHPPYILQRSVLSIPALGDQAKLIHPFPASPSLSLSRGSKTTPHASFIFAGGLWSKTFPGNLLWGLLNAILGVYNSLRTFSMRHLVLSMAMAGVHCCCQRMIRKTCVCMRLPSVVVVRWRQGTLNRSTNNRFLLICTFFALGC